jgi:hypothetical protein
MYSLDQFSSPSASPEAAKSPRIGDAIDAFETVWTELIVKIKGDAWKLTDKAIEELRQKKYPTLLTKQKSVAANDP